MSQEDDGKKGSRIEEDRSDVMKDSLMGALDVRRLTDSKTVNLYHKKGNEERERSRRTRTWWWTGRERISVVCQRSRGSL